MTNSHRSLFSLLESLIRFIKKQKNKYEEKTKTLIKPFIARADCNERM